MSRKINCFAILLALLLMPVLAFAEDLLNAGPTRNPQFADSYDPKNPGALIKEDIVAHSYLVMERNSEEILMAENETEQMFPGSTTKILTALIALQYGDLDDELEVSGTALMNLPEDVTMVGLKEGEIITLRDALYGMMLRSGNDAANVIAEYISGGINAFVALMNQEAANLGCANTNFMNPHGLHHEGHQTTARDLAVIMNAALDHPEFRKIIGTLNYTISTTNKNPARNLKNLVAPLDPDSNYYYPDSIGGKTGTHLEAAYVFVEAAERDGVELIAVVMFSNLYARWSDASRLLNFGFLQYESVTPEQLYNESPIKVEIKGYDPAEAQYAADEEKEDFRFGRVELAIRPVDPKNTMRITRKVEEIAELRRTFIGSHTYVQWETELRAPITAGQILGTLIFFSDEGPAEYQLMAKRSVTARPDAPPTLEEIEARVLADPSPFPPFSLDWVLPPFLIFLACLWGFRLLMRALFESSRGRKRIPKPTQRYFS